MTKLGLGDDIIVAKIRTSRCNFSLSDKDLLNLKQAGVSDKVIAAMLEASVLTSPEVSVDGKLMELHTLGQGKVGGRLGRIATVGLKSVKWKAYLQGPHASVYTSRNPMIVLELPSDDSINNYILVKMNGKDDRRELEMASAGGVVGGKTGVRAEDVVPTASTPLGGNRFQVVPNSPLKRGEYILYVLGSADAIRGVYGRGYDFSVE